MAKFDLTNVASAFVGHRIDEAERAELVKELGAAVRMPAKPVQLLVAQVAHECLEQPACTPETVIKIGIMYGLVLGVLCERERKGELAGTAAR